MTKAADRKDAHIALALDAAAQSGVDAGFGRVHLDHCALPETNLAAIDINTMFLGKMVSAPVFIGAMTGGTERADQINAALAKIAHDQNIALAVGSQRASLEGGRSQKSLREIAPNIPLIGNLGGVQLAREGGLDLARRAVDDLRADALAIHLNPLQEAAQIEGETNWIGVAGAIKAAVSQLPCPVIVKEVGAGISPHIANQLFDMGVHAIDVAGLGGTNWTRIETARRTGPDDDAARFTPFLDWGMTSVDCLINIVNARPDAYLIASGGIQNGLDVAKSLWLGASMASMAGAVLRALVGPDNGDINRQNALGEIARWRDQIALSLFLTGASSLEDFKMVPGHVTPL